MVFSLCNSARAQTARNWHFGANLQKGTPLRLSKWPFDGVSLCNSFTPSLLGQACWGVFKPLSFGPGLQGRSFYTGPLFSQIVLFGTDVQNTSFGIVPSFATYGTIPSMHPSCRLIPGTSPIASSMAYRRPWKQEWTPHLSSSQACWDSFCFFQEVGGVYSRRQMLIEAWEWSYQDCL